jgi:hypothetical protein
LTTLASDVTRGELAARGVDVDRVPSQPPPPPAWLVDRASALGHTSVRFVTRVLKFPLRAVLGAEPLWVVVVFGGALVFVVFKLLIYLLAQLLLVRPVPPHALPIAYVALGCYALVLAWLGVALWRTVGRVKSLAVKILSRGVALLCALYAVWGTINTVHLTQRYVSSAPTSVMDVAPGR